MRKSLDGKCQIYNRCEHSDSVRRVARWQPVTTNNKNDKNGQRVADALHGGPRASPKMNGSAAVYAMRHVIHQLSGWEPVNTTLEGSPGSTSLQANGVFMSETIGTGSGRVGKVVPFEEGMCHFHRCVIRELKREDMGGEGARTQWRRGLRAAAARRAQVRSSVPSTPAAAPPPPNA